MIRSIMLTVAAALVMLLGTARANAQAYDANWYTIDCGGETSGSGLFQVTGTIGQPEAGAATGGGFELSGGFWTVVDAPGCGSADFNCDGDLGTDADIAAFFACLSGDCPTAPCQNSADFNADGDLGTDADIEAFFRVLGGGSC